MADTYWDRFAKAAYSLGKRYFEESGIPDVVEELARLDDEDMSLADSYKTFMSAGIQGLGIPLQGLGSLSIEANRFSGASAMAAGRVLTGKPEKALEPYYNYATAWTPPSPQIQQKDGTYKQAQGVYHAATTGELIIASSDRFVANAPERMAPWVKMLMGAPYALGTSQLIAPKGAFENGTYIPAGWDIYAADAGTQINESDLRYAALLSDLATEMAIDPLNWAMSPIASVLKGRSLLHPSQAVKTLDTLGTAATRTEDLVDAAKMGTLTRRINQTPPGIGMWDQTRFAMETVGNPRMAEANTMLARNRDFGKALAFYSDKKLGLHPTAAAELAKASVFLDTPEDIAHLHMAAAYRNAASIDTVRDSLSIVNTPLANSLDSMLGLGDNIISQALIDFPNGSIIPRGHVLEQSAKSFLDNAFMQNPEAKKAWDALAKEEQARRFDTYASAIEEYQKEAGQRWTLAEQMFGEGRADQILPRTLTGKATTRALVHAGLKEPSTFSQALHGFTSKVHVIPGGAHRFNMKHLLMAKPGLVFDVDAADSGDKFNDFIAYASNIIGDGRGAFGRLEGGKNIPLTSRTISNRLPVDYNFAMDPEVIRIKNAFFDAATTTKNPGMLRSTLVDQLQEYALSKIAESSGFAPEVATYLAKMGMDRGRYINGALNSADNGFSTIVMEDGVPLVLTNHPTTTHQANVFVPFMDLAGVRKALHSAPMRVYTDRESLISLAEIDNLEQLAVRSKITGTNSLKAFGRTQHLPGKMWHGMVDIADLVNNTFKMAVLLRLGYPVRNLSEGYLSSVGSGVGLMKTLSHTEKVLANSGYNWSKVLSRLEDRMLTVSGFRANETALTATLEKSNAALQISTDHITDMIDAVTNPATIDSLIKVATDPNMGATEVQRAKDALAYLSQLKHRLATPIETRMVDERFAAATNVGQRLYHADSYGGMKVANDAIGRPLEIEAGVHAIPVSTRLDRPLSMTPFSGSAQGRIDTQWTPFVMSKRAVGAKNPRPGWAKKRVRSREEGERQWHEAMDYFDSLKETHFIEYRTGPDAQWKPFRNAKPGGKYRKYEHGATQKWEFRVRERGAKQVPPKVIGVDTYGKQIDLRNGYGRQAILDNYRDIDGSTIDAAIGGDRVAQEKLSNQLANHGVYRVVFDDGPEWGGVNVMVHPKGLGTEGLRNAVKDDVAQMVKAKMEAGGPVEVAKMPKGRPGQRRAWNKGMGHGLLQKRVEHIDPNFPFQLSDVLKNGGFDDILEEAIQQHVALKRQNVGLRTALQQRQAQTVGMAKRAGTPYMPAAYQSDYGEAYLTDSALNGIDGYKFRQLTSGDATIQSTIGFALHRGDQIDNLRASYLKPRDIMPTDPDYFEALSNLMGRFYRDMAGAVDSRSAVAVADPSAVLRLDDIDPVMLRALQPGDRERLYQETVDWAMRTPEGRNWVRSIGLQPRGADFADEATKVARAENAVRNPRVMRNTLGEPTRAATRDLTGQQHIPYREKGYQHRTEVDVERVIADHFNFADNFLLNNPRVAELFVSGEMSPQKLRALYDEAPWELKPFNGAVAPTSAESKAILRDMESKRSSWESFTNSMDRMMSNALQKIGSNPETRMLRHPMFEAIAQDDLQQRISAAEQMLGRRITATELYDLSERSRVFAVRRMKETLYTLESRSTLDDYLRFVAPFFPAWFNTATRWGRFYRRNPAGPAKIASRWQTLSGSGLIVDENGNEVTGSERNSAFQTYLLLPVGIGSFGPVQKFYPGAEEAMSKTRVPMRAFDVMFQGDPGNPGFGPLIGMPLQFVLEKNDDLYQNEVGRFIADKILPVGPENTGNRAMDAVYPFLPTGIKRMLDSVFDTNKQISQYNTAVMLLSTERLKGEYKGDDQQLLDDARKLSGLMSRVKVASAFVSPVAQQQQGYQDFIAGQWREIQDKAYAAGVGDRADEIFLKMYPMDFLLTLSTSVKLTGSQQTAYATANQEKYKDLQRLAITEMKDPGLLWFQDNYRETEDGQGAIDMYNSEDFNPFSRARQFNTSPEGTTDKYIEMRTAEEMQNEGLVRMGWIAYDKARAEVDARLVAQGYPEGSYEFLKRRREWMSGTAKALGESYPKWYEAYNSGAIETGKYAQRADFFRALTTNAEWLKGKENHELPKRISAYLDARDAAIVEMEKNSSTKTTASKENQDIKAALELKAQMLGKDSASFRLWYDRYFRNDVVNVDEGE